MESLFEQFANITKAHAYDIVNKQAAVYEKALRHVIERIKVVRPDDAFCQSLADVCKDALIPKMPTNENR